MKEKTESIDSFTTKDLRLMLLSKFKTFNEITKDIFFIDFVYEELKNIKIQRLNRKEPKPGFRFIRDWFDRMNDSHHLNADFFILNIEDIWNKQSSLNSETRNIIKIVCAKSLKQTLITYLNQSKNEADVNIKNDGR